MRIKNSRKIIIIKNKKKKFKIAFPAAPLKKIVRMFPFFILVLSPYIIFKIAGQLIPIYNIECVSQKGECSSYLNEKLILQNKNYLSPAKTKIAKLLNKDNSIKEFHIQYQLPGTLLVNVIERTPQFALANLTQSWVALVDEEGTVIALTDTTTFPTLITDQPIPNAGDKVSENTIFALRLLSGVWQYTSFEKAQLTENVLAISISPSTEVLLPLTGDRELILGSFYLVRAQLNTLAEETTMKTAAVASVYDFCINGCEIDLRYKNPVVRSSN